MMKADDADVLYEELLGKKMKKNTWRQYWVVLRGDRLVFICKNEQKIAGIVKLTEETTCKALGKKPSNRSLAKQKFGDIQESEDETCKFKLYAKKGVHLLKTDCRSSCEKWIEAISRAVQNLWEYTLNTPQTAPGYQGKCKFKVTFRKAWTSMFGYSALSEEEDGEEGDRLERRNENTTEIRNGKLRRFTLRKLHKKINFSEHMYARDKVLNYEVLIEEVID